MIEFIGVIGGLLAIFGVVLNNRRRTGCFYIWMISNSISLGLHVYAAIVNDAEVWSLAGRDAVFLVLAVDGLMRWSKK